MVEGGSGGGGGGVDGSSASGSNGYGVDMVGEDPIGRKEEEGGEGSDMYVGCLQQERREDVKEVQHRAGDMRYGEESCREGWESSTEVCM